jgi:Transglycosylase SLT domain
MKKTRLLACFRVLTVITILLGLTIVVLASSMDNKAKPKKVAAIAICVKKDSVSQTSLPPTQPVPHSVILPASPAKKISSPAESKSKLGKSFSDAKKTTMKKIKFFPAEVLAGLENSFRSKATVDSSIWKPSFGWPSLREVKWLARNTWGELAKSLCDYYKIGNCFSLIMDIFDHESNASPWAVNTSSGAVGLGQIVFKTGKNLSVAKECNIPAECLNRAFPEQNILNIIVLFKRNLAIFKAKGYENYRDWAILAHYAGPLAAEDTAAAHGGLYEVPFVQSILAIENLKPKVAPVWAQNLWAKEDWATIENIRRLAGGRTSKRVITASIASADND